MDQVRREGESNDEPNSNYAGLLDEVYFFVAVLTADEVKELYLEADSHEFRDIFCKLVCNRFFWAPCKSSILKDIIIERFGCGRRLRYRHIH